MADLVTLAEYKDYAKINSTNQDTALNSIIPKVSTLVKTYCRRAFIDYVATDKVEYFDGGAFFPLQEYPVISITKVEYSADFGQTYADLVNYTDFVLDKRSDTIVPPYVEAFPDAINGYRVSYKGGFSTLPEDLKLAVFDLITYYIKNDGVSHATRSPTSNSIQLEYITNSNFPSHIKRVLDMYMANYS